MSRVLSLCKYITCGHLLPFSPSSVWVWDQPGGERQRDQLCEYQTCSVMHWPRTWTGFSFSARVNPQWLLQFLTVWRRFMKSCSTRTPMSYRRNMREAALACCAVVFLLNWVVLQFVIKSSYVTPHVIKAVLEPICPPCFCLLRQTATKNVLKSSHFPLSEHKSVKMILKWQKKICF